MGAEYLPGNVPNANSFFHERGNDSIRKIHASTEIEKFEREGRNISFYANQKEDRDVLELPLVYYKGYYYTEEKHIYGVQQSENGLVEIPVKYSDQIYVYFDGTIIQNVSPYISLISYILLICYIIWFNRKQKNDKENRAAL